jgi:hypothetical protein
MGSWIYGAFARQQLSIPAEMAGDPRAARDPSAGQLILVAVGLFEITLGEVPESVRRLAIQRATGLD